MKILLGVSVTNFLKKVGFEPTKYFNTIDLQSTAVDHLAIFSHCYKRDLNPYSKAELEPKPNVYTISPLQQKFGIIGFEPIILRIKNVCLTIWLYSKKVT